MSTKEETPPQEVLDICKRPYARVLIPDEEAKEGEYAWCAFVLELPGCISDGRTPEEAAKNLESVMESWVWATVEKGQSIPEPRLTNDYSGKFLVRTSRSLHRQVAAYAAIEGTSMNQFISTTLAQEMGRMSLLYAQCSRCKATLPRGGGYLGKALEVDYKAQTSTHERLCKVCWTQYQEEPKDDD